MLRCSPVVGYEKRSRLIGSIGNGRRIIFAVARQYAHREIGHGILRRAKWTSRKNIWILTRTNGEGSILESAEGALVIIGVLRKCSHFYRVSTPYLGQRITELRSFLADCILPRRVVKDRSLREIREAGCPSTAVGRDVERGGLKNFAVGIAQRAPVGRRWIRLDKGEVPE